MRHLRSAAVLLLGVGWLCAPASAELPETSARQSPEVAPAKGGSPQGDAVTPDGRPQAAWPEATSDPVAGSLHRAWDLPAAALEERLERVQQAGLALGMRSLDGPARALLLETASGSALERASAAVRLAPDLPAARFALASARWSDQSHWEALGELRAAIRAVPHHLEAWLWVRAAALAAAAWACVACGLLFLVVAGCTALPLASRDLGAIGGALPAASCTALLAGIVLLPAVAGEGALGLALGLSALALAYGSLASRLAVLAAALLLLAGLFPLSEQAGRAATALTADPVAEAAFAVERGVPTAAEVARVRRAAAHDPLAARALALREKREGLLAEADERYRPLLERAEPSLLNNAANVRLTLGRTQEAIPLYEVAAREARSPVILFNLAQAYGSAIQLDLQESALAEAQLLDSARVADLTRVSGASPIPLLLDVPPSAASLVARLVDPRAAADWAARGRRPLAPGWSGRHPSSALLALLVAACGGLSAGLALRRLSHNASGRYYESVANLLQSRGGKSAERMARLAEIRARQARVARVQLVLSCVVPGAAGLLAGRPFRGLLAALAFSGALSAWLHRNGVVPDPLAVGTGAPLGVAAVIAVLALLYLLLTGLSLARRES